MTTLLVSVSTEENDTQNEMEMTISYLKTYLKRMKKVCKEKKEYRFITIQGKDKYQITVTPQGKYFKNIVYGYTIP